MTSLVTLEASYLASLSSSSISESKQHNSMDSGSGAGFLSISRLSLPGEILTASLFWFLLTAIIVAYVSEGGQLVSQSVEEALSLDITPEIGSLIFATFFASLAIFGTSSVDTINRVFVFGLVATFVCLVGIGLPMVNISNLIEHSDWSMIYPPVISIGILSFGAQNIVPTLLEYLNYDSIKTRQSILIGSLLPLFLYTIWEGVFLGVIDISNADGGNRLDVISVLGQVGGSSAVTDLVAVFSLCAICSSMAGASVSLVDFFQDAISTLFKFESSNKSESESRDKYLQGVSKTRVLAAMLALGPPVILTFVFPDIFLVALEEAGLLGGVSLYGIIPAVSILAIRRSSLDIAKSEMPGKLEGPGDIALVFIVVISFALVLPEIQKLLGNVLTV